LRHAPFPRINFPLADSPKQPGAALGCLEVDHADHQRASDRVSRIPPTPSSSAREGFGPFDTDHRGWCLVADLGAPLEHARIVGGGPEAYYRSPGAHCRCNARACACPRDAASQIFGSPPFGSFAAKADHLFPEVQPSALSITERLAPGADLNKLWLRKTTLVQRDRVLLVNLRRDLSIRSPELELHPGNSFK
jgi:hypothetical protein